MLFELIKMSFDLINLKHFKHLSFLHIPQSNEYFLQYLQCSLLQNLHSFKFGNILLIKSLYYLIKFVSLPKIDFIPKKKFFLKKKA